MKPAKLHLRVLGLLCALAAVAALLFHLRGPTLTSRTVPGLDLRLMPIPAGTFTMGSPADEAGRTNDEGPPTRVTLTREFYLGATDVTQAQWIAIMGSNPSNFEGDLHPVENVTWDEAMIFCKKLTERERTAGRMPVGWELTLPTEAQWEYACRAGTTGPYAGELDAMAWYSKSTGLGTHPVGTKQPNAWGLYDMHGNVAEWCLDWYGSYLGGAVTDPPGPASGSVRVFRGGSWHDDAPLCRSAYREYLNPAYRSIIVGFRLALSPVRQ